MVNIWIRSKNGDTTLGVTGEEALDLELEGQEYTFYPQHLLLYLWTLMSFSISWK